MITLEIRSRKEEEVFAVIILLSQRTVVWREYVAEEL